VSVETHSVRESFLKNIFKNILGPSNNCRSVSVHWCSDIMAKILNQRNTNELSQTNNTPNVRTINLN
jgi:hypothetical protein